MPGAEVLRGEVTASDLAEVVVDVVALDVDPLASGLVGKQLGTTAATPLQRPDVVTQRLVGERLHPVLAALRDVVERQHAAGTARHVVATHRRQPERAGSARVLV